MRISHIAPFAVSAALSRACGRGRRVSARSARRFGCSNDAAGHRTAISRSGEAFGDLSGAVDAYGYNLRSEVVSARRTKDGASVRGFDEDFSYDPIGNRVATTNYDETGSAIVSQYEANSLNQYTSRTVPGVAAARGFADADATVTVNENPAYRLGEYFYGSDEFDNSQSSVDAALVTAAALASPTNGPDEVASVTSRVHVARTPQTFEYDLDGNQTLVTTKTGTWRVKYNGENRPVLWERVAADSNTLTSNTQTRVSMSFDHQGRRRMYLEAAADGSTNSLDRFTYDNYLCIARNRWQQDGTSVADRFVWDPTEPVATRPLVFYQPNAPHQLYSIDGNKNVSELVSSADGSISAHYEYAPFGEVILSSGDLALNNPFRFSSEYADDTLSLVYYNYRHLDPATGRWTQRDAVERHLAETLMLYANNSPIALYDVIGLSCNKFGGVGVSLNASGSVYVGIGGSLSVSLSSTVYHCCCDGKIHYSDAYDVGVTISGSIGIGVAARINAPILGNVGFEILGPQYTISGGLSYSKDCGEVEPNFLVTIVDLSGDIGGSFNFGSVFGASISYWAKYSLSVTALISGRSVSISVGSGWHGGGDFSVYSPIVNISREFSLFDYQSPISKDVVHFEW